LLATALLLSTLFAATAPIGNPDLAARVENYYASVLQGKVVRWDLDIRRLPELKQGAEIVAIHGEENRSEPPRGARVCWIKVKENGRFRDLPATVTVKPVERVPVALQDIQPRTPITRDLFTIAEVETQSFGATHLPTVAELSEVWAKVRIPGQSVITEKRIAPIPVVVVGQSLKIVFRLGQIEAVAEGKALEDGRIGERIRVLNLVSGNRLKCRVENEDLVSVE